jgi:alkylation response protein AidB-like acyl-CoA dehydrogenase
MDFTPTSAQRDVEARARTFAQETLAPVADSLDRDGGFPRESLARAAELGLLGIGVPEALGGLGAGAVAYSLAITQTGRVCASTTVAMCVSNMVAEVITAFGTPQQRAEHVPRLCRGEYVVGAFALSEAGAGSDPGAMRTTARRTDRGWILEGSKLWITSGTHAGLFVVWARTGEGTGTSGISCFLVPAGAPGLSVGRPEHKMGLRGSTTTPLLFEGVELPADALLGQPGQGFKVAMMALDGGRIGIASQALGLGLGALDVARAWVCARGIEAEQGVAWPLADAATALQAASLLTLRAAWLKELGRPFSKEASLAKVFATEKAFAACDRVLAVLGEAGHTEATPAERFFRDVRVTMIYEGTSEIQRLVISRDIMRRFAEAA